MRGRGMGKYMYKDELRKKGDAFFREKLHCVGAENVWKCQETFFPLCLTLFYDLSPLIWFESICIYINTFYSIAG